MNRRHIGTGALCMALLAQVKVVWAQPAIEGDQPPIEFALENAPAFSPKQMYRVMADVFTRSCFSELRALPIWGPDHPAWSRHLPAFADDMQALLQPQGVTLDAHLSGELRRELTSEELSELNATVLAPDFQVAINQISEMGLSWGNLVLVPMIGREPKFYSTSERVQARAMQSALSGEFAAKPALGNQLKPIAAFLETPTFLKYQSAAIRIFTADARRMRETPEKKRGFELLMQRWHARLKNGKVTPTRSFNPLLS